MNIEVDALADAFTWFHVQTDGWCSESHMDDAIKYVRSTTSHDISQCSAEWKQLGCRSVCYLPEGHQSPHGWFKCEEDGQPLDLSNVEHEWSVTLPMPDSAVPTAISIVEWARLETMSRLRTKIYDAISHALNPPRTMREIERATEKVMALLDDRYEPPEVVQRYREAAEIMDERNG